jgi:hypothetical protein
MSTFPLYAMIRSGLRGMCRLSDIAEQFGNSDAEPARDLKQARDRNVRFATLDIAHVGPVQSASMRKFFLAPSPLFAQASDPFSKSKE